MSLLIGLDLGTTTIKAILYDSKQGRVIDRASQPTPVSHSRPHPDWIEHSPQALWEAVCHCLRQVAQGQPVSALAVSSFAEAGLPVDGQGQPLYPLIAWYDRRTLPQMEWWEREFSILELHGITGQFPGPSFGANKWLWLRKHQPKRMARMARWLSTPDYVLYRLTGTQATDYTMASRTLLLDQRARTWSEEVLQRAGLPVEQLPPIFPSGTVIGSVTPQAASETGLPVGMPCVLGGHDHLCGALAAGGWQSGAVIDSTGTAEALLMVVPAFQTGQVFAGRSFACYAHVVPGQYIIKGGLKAAGVAIEWLARQLCGQPGLPADQLPYAELESSAWQGYGKRAGPLWLPHLLGSGSPLDDSFSRGALVGLKSDHQPGDLFRGLLESLAFWMRHNLVEMGQLSGQQTGQVLLLGGTTRLKLLRQLKADVLNQAVLLPEIPEASATGAALLAGIGAGVFSGPQEAVASLHYNVQVVQPNPECAAWYHELYDQAYMPLYGALRSIHQTLARLD